MNNPLDIDRKLPAVYSKTGGGLRTELDLPLLQVTSAGIAGLHPRNPHPLSLAQGLAYVEVTIPDPDGKEEAAASTVCEPSGAICRKSGVSWGAHTTSDPSL